MDITIRPRCLSGQISVIPSKSQAHRLLICAAFAEGTTQLHCPDTNRDIEAPHEIQLELLKLLPGTYFRDNSEKLGIKFSPEPPYEVLQTPAISFDELCKSMVISKMIDYWYNDESWRAVFGEIATNEHNFIQKFVDHLCKTAFMEHTYSFEGKSNILYQFCKNEYPQYLINITLGWIKNGLSIKKEPAGQLKMWHFTNSTINNPVFEENNVYNCYYYLDYKDERHWFVFNKHILRDKPITYFKEIIIKS